MANAQTTHTVNTSEARLDTALSWLRAHRDTLAPVGRDAAILAAVGLLICDEDGHFSQPELFSAMADPECVSAAELLVNAAVS